MTSPMPTILSFCTKEKEKKVTHSVTSSTKITLQQHKREREKSLRADKAQFPVMVVKGKRHSQGNHSQLATCCATNKGNKNTRTLGFLLQKNKITRKGGDVWE